MYCSRSTARAGENGRSYLDLLTPAKENCMADLPLPVPDNPLDDALEGIVVDLLEKLIMGSLDSGTGPGGEV